MKKTPQHIVDAVLQRRREGAVFNELVQEFGLAKSTVSLLCADLVLTPEEEIRIEERRLAGRPFAISKPKTPEAEARRKEGSRLGGLRAQAKLRQAKVPLTPEEVEARKVLTRAKNMVTYRERRERALSELGGRCSVDGCPCPREQLRLVADDRKFASVYLRRFDSFLAIVKSEFRLLCSRHEARERVPESHGSYAGYYRLGCRCDECSEYSADLVLRRREDRRKAKLDADLEKAGVKLHASYGSVEDGFDEEKAGNSDFEGRGQLVLKHTVR